MRRGRKNLLRKTRPRLEVVTVSNHRDPMMLAGESMKIPVFCEITILDIVLTLPNLHDGGFGEFSPRRTATRYGRRRRVDRRLPLRWVRWPSFCEIDKDGFCAIRRRLQDMETRADGTGSDHSCSTAGHKAMIQNAHFRGHPLRLSIPFVRMSN